MRILCVTSVKNEAPFLLEWIAHNQNIGVTDFLIFSNDCEDGTHELLESLKDAGVIEHVPQIVSQGDSPQWQALRAAWKHPLRKSCDWAIVCDVDEFVNIHVGQGKFADLIGTFTQDIDGVLLPWRLFGNNGHAFYKDRAITELYTASMAEDCNYPIAATFFKSMIKTDGPFNQFGVHRPKQKPVEKSRLPIWVNGGGQKMPEFFARNPQRLSLYGSPNDRSLVECNHYSLKSAENFLVKRARGLPNRSEKNIDLTYWVERNFNTVENHSITRIRAGTKKRYIDLLSVPNVRHFHERAVQWHRNKFLGLMKSEAEHQIFSQILVSGSSQCPPPDIIRQIITWYQHIHHEK